jgi:hypothetical protein
MVSGSEKPRGYTLRYISQRAGAEWFVKHSVIHDSGKKTHFENGEP